MLKASARRLGDGFKHEISIGQHLLHSDEPEKLGGTGEAPSPQELLAGSLAACTATTVEMYARYREWELGEVVVNVDYDSHSNPKRFVVALCLRGELSAEQRRRLGEVARRCMVRQTLEGEIEFEERIEAPR